MLAKEGGWLAAVREGAVWALGMGSLRPLSRLFPLGTATQKESGGLTKAEAGRLARHPGVPQAPVLGKGILHVAIRDARGQVACAERQMRARGTLASAPAAHRRWQAAGRRTGAGGVSTPFEYDNSRVVRRAGGGGRVENRAG